MNTERLNRAKIEQDIFEMWDAISHIPQNEPDRDFAIKQAQDVESKLKGQLYVQDFFTNMSNTKRLFA